MTLHPTARKFTTDNKDYCASFGIIFAWRALSGSFGQSITHSCVDCMLVPSGIIILILFMVGTVFLTCACTAIKWSILPESNML